MTKCVFLQRLILMMLMIRMIKISLTQSNNLLSCSNSIFSSSTCWQTPLYADLSSCSCRLEEDDQENVEDGKSPMSSNSVASFTMFSTPMLPFLMVVMFASVSFHCYAMVTQSSA